MNIEKQNEFLLSLVNRLYLEVGAHKVLAEMAKNRMGSREVDSILAEARSDSALRSHTESACEILAAALPLVEDSQADRMLAGFLSRLNGQQAQD